MNTYDSELPAGFQDADFEMAALTAAGNRSAALKRKGLCDHGWLRATLLTADGVPADRRRTCNDCEQIFADQDEAYEARARVLNGDDDE